MKEVQSLDQAAKAHMEEAFQLNLEEKDEKINVMATQVGGVVSGKRVHDQRLSVCIQYSVHALGSDISTLLW